MVTGAQDAQSEGLANLIDDLAIDGESGVSVQPELDDGLVLHIY